VVIPAMALQDTVRHGVKTDAEGFASEVVALLKNPQRLAQLRREALSDNYLSWEAATDLLETVALPAWLKNKVQKASTS